MKTPPTLFDQITPALWLQCVTQLTSALIISHKDDDTTNDDCYDQAVKLMEERIIEEIPFGNGYDNAASICGSRFPYQRPVAGWNWEDVICSPVLYRHLKIEQYEYNGAEFLFRWEPEQVEEFTKLFPNVRLFEHPSANAWTHAVPIGDVLCWAAKVEGWEDDLAKP